MRTVKAGRVRRWCRPSQQPSAADAAAAAAGSPRPRGQGGRAPPCGRAQRRIANIVKRAADERAAAPPPKAKPSFLRRLSAVHRAPPREARAVAPTVFAAAGPREGRQRAHAVRDRPEHHDRRRRRRRSAGRGRAQVLPRAPEHDESEPPQRPGAPALRCAGHELGAAHLRARGAAVAGAPADDPGRPSPEPALGLRAADA